MKTFRIIASTAVAVAAVAAFGLAGAQTSGSTTPDSTTPGSATPAETPKQLPADVNRAADQARTDGLTRPADGMARSRNRATTNADGSPRDVTTSTTGAGSMAGERVAKVDRN